MDYESNGKPLGSVLHICPNVRPALALRHEVGHDAGPEVLHEREWRQIRTDIISGTLSYKPQSAVFRLLSS